MLEDIQAAVGRAHILLFVTATGVLALTLPGRAGVGDALDELAVLRESLGERGLVAACANTARSWYRDLWDGLVEVETTDRLRGLEPDVGGYVGCPRLEAEASLEAVARFLVERHRVDLVNVNLSTREELSRRIADVVERQRARDLSLVSVHVVDPTKAESAVLVLGPDTISVQLVEREERNRADTFDVALRFTSREADVMASSTFGLETPGSTFGRSLPPVSAWARGGSAIVDTVDGQLRALPRSASYWEEIRTLSLGEAVRYLRARAEEAERKLEVAGVALDADVVAFAGPFIILVTLAFMIAQIEQLRSWVREKVEGRRHLRIDWTWVGFFPNAYARATLLITLGLLPPVACVSLAWRMWDTSVGASLWAGVAGVVSVILALRVLEVTRELRGRPGYSTEGSRGGTGEEEGASSPGF